MSKKITKNNNKTKVCFVLDETGSMSVVRDATISGFNEYLTTLKNDKKSSYEFSLTLFNTQKTEKRYVDEPIEKIKALDTDTYQPNMGTPLYDAVCRTINEVEGRVSKKDKVVFVVLTDGEENSSVEYDQVKMKALIDKFTKAGNWTFVYMGANQDSWVNAQKYGFSAGNTANFVATSAGVNQAFYAMANATSGFSGTGQASTTTIFGAGNVTVNIGEQQQI